MTPDIVTIGKPFGNGHPLAAVIVLNPNIIKAFSDNCGVEIFSTTGGSTLSCAVGLGVIHSVIKDDLMRNASLVGA